MESKRILLVDDERLILKTLSRELKVNNYAVLTAESGEEAVELLKSHPFDLVLTDLRMDRMSGIEVLKRVKQMQPDTGVIILTGHGDLSSAIEALRYGAADYLLKPCDVEELLFRIADCLGNKETPAEPAPKGVALPSRAPSDGPALIGAEPVMQELNNLIREAAGVDFPVLIQGESGTGKELVAQNIHEMSPRKNRPFIVVNCAALPHELVESELFGHVRGAFTGAAMDKKGRFELADGGSIFFDEIGELPLDLQAKLLRVLQEGAFERLGGTKTVTVDVRLISATNRDLMEEVKRGGFRLDLYYRLCVVPIVTPPLRERPADIPLLADYFIARFARERGGGAPGVAAPVRELFRAYSWPGNVRELQNVVQFSLMKSKGGQIEVEHLPVYIVENLKRSLPSLSVGSSARKLDREAVLEALARASGNKVQAAKELGVARATLYRFLKDGM